MLTNTNHDSQASDSCSSVPGGFWAIHPRQAGESWRTQLLAASTDSTAKDAFCSSLFTALTSEQKVFPSF